MQKSFEKKLNEIKAVADELPVILIIHNILKGMSIEYMSPRGLKELKLSMEDLQKLNNTEYHARFFNPEDAADYIPKITRLLEEENTEEQVTFFQQVRSSEEHEWVWHLSTTTIFMQDEKGMPTHLLTVACPIDPLHHVTPKVNRLLEENNFLRNHQETFSSLTKREKEILKLIAPGKNSSEIASALFLSEKTIITHRRNIKRKLNAGSNYDITRFAQAFDLI